MNTPSNAMQESSFGAQGFAPAVISATRPFYWSLRRELWENHLIYKAPLAVATFFLASFVINMIALRHRMHGIWRADPAQQLKALAMPLAMPHEISAALIMGIALVVGIFYTLDALYGERRDRSILFWKSLPVSDLTTVLSKLIIPLIVIPLLSFAITIVTQFIMLLMGSALLMGSGANIASLWTQQSFFQVSLDLFYHMFTVHGLWYAPIYGWLLLVSAASPRAPLIWAVLPPFVICGVEKIAFNTTYFLAMLEERFIGPPAHASMAPANAPMDPMSTLIPHHFFSEPGLWIGLAIAAVFIAAAVRLRRYRGPI
jgi:ABC-2 type transport system permease protein